MEYPKMYNAILYCDKTADKDFLTKILHDIFNVRNKATLDRILNELQTNSKAVVETKSLDVIVTKNMLIDEYSKKCNYPIKMEVEECK